MLAIPFQWDLCDMDRDTNRHLHQRVAEHMQFIEFNGNRKHAGGSQNVKTEFE